MEFKGLYLEGKQIGCCVAELEELTIKELIQMAKESNLKMESSRTSKPIKFNLYKPRKSELIKQIIRSFTYTKYLNMSESDLNKKVF